MYIYVHLCTSMYIYVHLCTSMYHITYALYIWSRWWCLIATCTRLHARTLRAVMGHWSSSAQKSQQRCASWTSASSVQSNGV